MATWQGYRPVKLMKHIKLALRLSVYLPLSLLVFLALMLGTGFGARVSIWLANATIEDLHLVYEAGRLNKRLRLSLAEYSQPGVQVSLTGLDLTWQPMCLLQYQLCIEELSLSNVDIRVNTQELAARAKAPPPVDEVQWQLPLEVGLERLRLADIQVDIDGQRLSADELSVKGRWQAQGLTLDELKSLGLRLSQTDTGSEAAAQTPPGTADTTAPIETNTAKKDSTKGTQDAAPWPLAELPQITVPFPIQVKALQFKDTQLHLLQRQEHIDEIRLSAAMQRDQLVISALDLTHAYGALALQGDITLAGAYPIALSVALTLNEIPELAELSHQRLTLNLAQDLGQLLIQGTLGGNLALELLAEINLQNPELPYRLSLSQAAAKWPVEKPTYFLREVSLQSHGDLQRQFVNLSGTVDTPFHPTMSVQAELNHSVGRVEILSLGSQSELGTARLNGELEYGHLAAGSQFQVSTRGSTATLNGIKWHTKVEMDELALQHLHLGDSAQIPETLVSGFFASQGYFARHNSGDALTNRWHLALSDIGLAGMIRAYPFKLEGSLAMDDRGNVQAEALKAEALGASLLLHGSSAQEWDLAGELKVPDLGLWLPNSKGRLEASLNASGPDKHPTLSLNAALEKLAINGIKAGKTEINAQWRPRDSHAFALNLASQKLRFQGTRIGLLTLNAKGDEYGQQATLHTEGDLKVDTRIDSQYQPKTKLWQARIADFSFDALLGPWQLDNPIALEWQRASDRGSIAPFCLSHDSGNLCLEDGGEFGPQGQLALAYKGYLGQLFRPLLPTALEWQGLTRLQAGVSWRPGVKPSGQLELNFAPETLVIARSKQRRLEIDYQQLSLMAKLDPEQLTTKLNINARELVQLESELTVKVSPDRTISGFAHVQQLDMAPLGELTPQLDKLAGNLSSNLQFAGTLAHPRVTGRIAMTDGAMTVAANPTVIEAMNVELLLEGERGELTGKWRMGDGHAGLNGQLAWPQGQFSGDVSLEGTALTFIQPPQAILEISPNLRFQFDKTRLDVQGKVAIPKGRIKIIQLAEGGIALSDDVVFEDTIAESQVKTSPFAVTAKLNVDVGNDLRIDGMGLKGKLEGTLTLRQKAFRPPLLFGDIKIVNGSYKFMGQKLAISTGIVQFVGPIEDPNLNIEAIRIIKAENVTAGVRITGTPKRPVVALFSDPNKEQAEILSYIIKGKGLNNFGNEQSDNMMVSAAVGLGSHLGSGAINSIGRTTSNIIEKFGFSNVQLDTNDEGRVAISGYIGEDLMVKYGVGVFNPGYEMTVRYYLLSQLYLETVSSTLGQSLDIYYHFDL